MYVYIWEYRLAPIHLDEFVQHYGPQGTWVELFKRAEGYVGTDLIRDREDPTRFITIDRWDGAASHAAFRSAFKREYDALDVACEALTSSEQLLGTFELV